MKRIDVEPDDEVTQLISEIDDLKAFGDDESSSFLPVYYNAWENDYWDDPLPTLAACIAAVAGEEPNFEMDTIVSSKLCAVLDLVFGAVVNQNGFENSRHEVVASKNRFSTLHEFSRGVSK